VTQYRPHADFVKFCDTLAETNQQHVVDQYLTKDAVQSVGQHTVGVNQAAVSTVYSIEGNIVESWRTVLIQRRSAIIDLLDSSDDFVNRLVTYGVMNFATGELCRVSTTQHRTLA